jgi:hypothetical protein
MGYIVICAFRSVFGAKWNAWVPMWMAFSGIGLVSGRVSPRSSIIYTQFYDYISRVWNVFRMNHTGCVGVVLMIGRTEACPGRLRRRCDVGRFGCRHISGASPLLCSVPILSSRSKILPSRRTGTGSAHCDRFKRLPPRFPHPPSAWPSTDS